jgi:UDP:flavonoid glycosyltransferase YjiC (YdhE family)
MRVLFASMPFDGHFNPLTGIAVHLKSRGYDVRWYCGPSYAKKLAAMGIPHYTFKRARDLNGQNLTELHPEYKELGEGPKAIAFATEKLFFSSCDGHYADIKEIHAEWPFDAFIYDGAMYAGHLVREKIQPKAYLFHPAPTPASTSKTAPPPFFGLKPATNIFGRIRDRVVTHLVEGSIKKGKAMFNTLLVSEGLPPFEDSVFNLPVHARAWFNAGVPGMDFPREDRPPNFQFVGATLPYKSKSAPESMVLVEEKLKRHASLVVVSQGTVDNRDPEKLFIPTIEALKATEHLVVVTTGHQNTALLHERYSEENVVIADWIDFELLMEKASLFISNGGYGSIMHALVKGVPLLLAGKLEGKNDINARLDYNGIGLDLNTERPTADQIRRGVARVLGEKRFKEGASRIQRELARYDANQIIEKKLIEDGVVPTAHASGISTSTKEMYA